MPLDIVRNDITKMEVDAIVNAANETLLGGGGVDGAIHAAAGPALLRECRTLHGCPTGEAKITGAGRLPCRYVIHTVGPVWRGGEYGEREQLASCYRAALYLAKEKECQSVAFPLISAGAYGYPKDQALRVAVDTIGAFLLENDLLVYLVIFDRTSYWLGGKLFPNIQSYIDDRYVQEHTDFILEARRAVRANVPPPCTVAATPPKSHKKKPSLSPFHKKGEAAAPWENQDLSPCTMPAPPYADSGLDEALRRLDESFSQMLLRKIDEKGMTDSQCYKKANIDRKLFSKIRTDPQYRPSKPTALAFAIALELSLEDTRELLRKAGFALSHSSKFDIIVEYFLSRGNYNIFEINEALFAFDQSLLGC